MKQKQTDFWQRSDRIIASARGGAFLGIIRSNSWGYCWDYLLLSTLGLRIEEHKYRSLAALPAKATLAQGLC